MSCGTDLRHRDIEVTFLGEPCLVVLISDIEVTFLGEPCLVVLISDIET